MKISDLKSSTTAEPASAILWTYFYLAQHYDYLNDTVKALQYINMAIEHTPTLIELFVGKGRIFKVFSYHGFLFYHYFFLNLYTNSTQETQLRLIAAWMKLNRSILPIVTSTQNVQSTCSEPI